MQNRLTPEGLGLAITDAREKPGQGGLLAQVAIMEHAGTCTEWPLEMRQVAVDLYNGLAVREQKKAGAAGTQLPAMEIEGHPGSQDRRIPDGISEVTE